MRYKVLSEFCALNMGQSPDSSTYNDQGEGLPFYQGNADFGSIHPQTRVWCSAPVKRAHADDILISVRAPIGAMNIATEECCIGRGLAALTPKQDVCSQKYLYYALESCVDLLVSKGTGSTFKAISKKTLEETAIPAYSLEEQEEITSIIGQTDALIEARKRQLLELDILVKSRFIELTEDADAIPTRMGDIATYINGYAFKPTQWENSGYPIIRIQNLNDATAPYNYFSGKIPDKYLVHNGDVLVSWATHLEAYIWNGNDAWLNQHIFKVVFDKMNVNKTYYVYACEEALRQAFKNAHGFKPTMEHIKKCDFDDAVVRLPDLKTQQQFAAFVAEVDKSKLAVQKSLNELETLKKSLMQKYFG